VHQALDCEVSVREEESSRPGCWVGVVWVWWVELDVDQVCGYLRLSAG